MTWYDGAMTNDKQKDPMDTEREKRPKGTAYVTPDGVVGVIGHQRGGDRPLEHADTGALGQMSGLIRKEMANR